MKSNGKDVEFNKEMLLGIYRSPSSEQQVEYFEKDKTIFVHYKNQQLNIGLSAKENEMLLLNPTWTSRSHYIFEKDSLGNVIRVKVNQFTEMKSTLFYYYKETDEIRKAYDLFKSSDKKGLGKTFQTLVDKYPNHWFLKDALRHVNYVNSLTEKELKKQLETVVGTYANRIFWVENNRLFYKRDNLARIELFPISETRYINLSKYATNYEFEFLSNGKIASFAWIYDIEKEEWRKMDDKTNYLLKN